MAHPLRKCGINEKFVIKILTNLNILCMLNHV